MLLPAEIKTYTSTDIHTHIFKRARRAPSMCSYIAQSNARIKYVSNAHIY